MVSKISSFGFVGVLAVVSILALSPMPAYAQFGGDEMGDGGSVKDFGGYSVFDTPLGYGNDEYSIYDTPLGYGNDDGYSIYDTPLGYGDDGYSIYDTPLGYDSDGYSVYDTPLGYGGSSPSFGGTSMGGGYNFGGTSMSRSSSYGYSYAQPMTFYAPTYRPTPTPTHTATASNTYNNCVNNSCNTTYVDNSINNSVLNSGTIQNSAIAAGIETVATIYPIQTAPVQYPVQYTYAAQPSCTITITYNTNNAYGPYSNQLATLTWSALNATSAYISPTVGTVSNYGSMTVYPTNGQIYSMTVYGQGGTATCRTQAYYAPVAPTPVPSNPTPYVSLSQIPYTGFDFGALGNSIYWLSLVAFASALAYLVLYFQGGALAILGTRTARTQVVMPRITVSKAPAVAPVAHKEAAVVSPIQIAHTKPATDNMEVKFSKAGEMPRIIINRG